MFLHLEMSESPTQRGPGISMLASASTKATGVSLAYDSNHVHVHGWSFFALPQLLLLLLLVLGRNWTQQPAACAVFCEQQLLLLHLLYTAAAGMPSTLMMCG
jgi:hypothetical protein